MWLDSGAARARMENEEPQRSLWRDSGLSWRAAQRGRVPESKSSSRKGASGPASGSEIASRLSRAAVSCFRCLDGLGHDLIRQITRWQRRYFSRAVACGIRYLGSSGSLFEMPDHFRIGMGVNTEMFAERLNRLGHALTSG